MLKLRLKGTVVNGNSSREPLEFILADPINLNKIKLGLVDRIRMGFYLNSRFIFFRTMLLLGNLSIPPVLAVSEEKLPPTLVSEDVPRPSVRSALVVVVVKL